MCSVVLGRAVSSSMLTSTHKERHSFTLMKTLNKFNYALGVKCNLSPSDFQYFVLQDLLRLKMKVTILLAVPCGNVANSPWIIRPRDLPIILSVIKAKTGTCGWLFWVAWVECVWLLPIPWRPSVVQRHHNSWELPRRLKNLQKQTCKSN